MSKNNKEQEKSKAKETEKVETKAAANQKPANTSEKENKKDPVKKTNGTKIAIIISAAVLVTILITVGIVLFVDYLKNDKGFDYFKADLSKYVSFNSDFKDIVLNVDIAKPHDTDVDTAILGLLAANKNKDALNEGKKNTDPTVIGPGDLVYIWYRGYLKNGDEEIYIHDLTNFSQNEAGALEIGSGEFYPGIELGLNGLNTGDYPKFEKIKTGKVSELGENAVIYVNYSRATLGENPQSVTKSNVRIDLSSDVDKEFGEGFLARIKPLSIGATEGKLDFTTKDGKYRYTNLSVSFATECEGNPLTLEGYIPYDTTNPIYRNETIYVEIYFDGVLEYDAPKFTNEFLQGKIDDKTLGVTLEKLNEYPGEQLTDKYRKYAEEVIWNIYEENYKSAVKETVWTHYLSIANVSKYPKHKVEEIYEEFINEVNIQYQVDNGYIVNSSTGAQTQYTTLDQYAAAYYGIQSLNMNWKDYVYKMSENLVKERLVMYYILRTENLIPTDEEFDKIYKETVQEYVDALVEKSLVADKKTREDFTDAEYEKYVADCKSKLFTYYDEEYFREAAYYTVLLDAVIDSEWIEVKTLDERRAYPIDK